MRDYRLYARINYHARALGDERAANLDLLTRQASDNLVVEALLLAYLDLEQFRNRCGVELAEAFPDELRVLARLDLAQLCDGELRLTRRGGRHLREIRYLFASPAVVTALETAAGAGL